MDIVIGIILIASAIFLIVAVLLQSGKDKGLSGALSGSSSDTFYGKNKGNTKERILSKATTVISVIFVVLVLVSFVIQDDTDLNNIYDQLTATDSADSDSADTTDTADTGDDTKESVSEEDTSGETETSGSDTSSAEET